MAYILGFITADGTIRTSKTGGKYLDIHITDKPLLMSVRKRLAPAHAISERVRDPRWKTGYRLQIGSKTIYSDLQCLGVTEVKSRRLHIPPSMPSVFVGAYARGYFDGDGNVWMGTIHKKRKTQHIALLCAFTSASASFLYSFKQLLETRGLRGGSLMRRGEYARLQYASRNSLLLHDLMYSSCCVDNLYLERKKKVFDAFIVTLRA